MLRLHDAGVQFLHVPEVLSVFGVDGHNLSTHAGMEMEAERIRLANGGSRLWPVRAVAYGARRLERLVRGGYRSVSLQYRYAIDEVPHYAHFRATHLGGRYTLADTVGRAERIVAAEVAAERGGQKGRT